MRFVWFGLVGWLVYYLAYYLVIWSFGTDFENKSMGLYGIGNYLGTSRIRLVDW